VELVGRAVGNSIHHLEQALAHLIEVRHGMAQVDVRGDVVSAEAAADWCVSAESDGDSTRAQLDDSRLVIHSALTPKCLG
jgi:hypothetical protein